MRVEKALNFWMEDMNRKRVVLFITLYYYYYYYYNHHISFMELGHMFTRTGLTYP